MKRTPRRIYYIFGTVGGLVASLVTYQLVLNRLDLPYGTFDFTILLSALSLSIFFVPVGIAVGLSVVLVYRIVWSLVYFHFGSPESGQYLHFGAVGPGDYSEGSAATSTLLMSTLESV